jgi:hypothetical protein
LESIWYGCINEPSWNVDAVTLSTLIALNV